MEVCKRSFTDNEGRETEEEAVVRRLHQLLKAHACVGGRSTSRKGGWPISQSGGDYMERGLHQKTCDHDDDRRLCTKGVGIDTICWV